jgi:hypothetical protein
MIYTKPIDRITYEDVLAFCAQRERESMSLDYKRQLEASVHKTIAAMANTWGGVILIGVEEEDSRPRLPVPGIAFEERIPERVNSIVLGNITPPVFPEVAVPRSDDGTRAFVVIRVPQSNLGPHAIRGNTRAYVRTSTANEPEELATVDRVLWLVDRRNRSVRLRESFYQRAAERWDTEMRRRQVPALHGELTLAACPLYPRDPLIDYRLLRQDIPNAIVVHGWNGVVFPVDRVRGNLGAVQEGAAGLFHVADTNYVIYEELNRFGFFYHREDIVDSETQREGTEVHRLILHRVLIQLDLFLEAMASFYERIGYWGLVEVHLRIKKGDIVQIADLPPGSGFTRWEDIRRRPVDNVLLFERTVGARELREDRPSIVSDVMAELTWAAGFPHSGRELVMRLLNDAGRG